MQRDNSALADVLSPLEMTQSNLYLEFFVQQLLNVNF